MGLKLRWFRARVNFGNSSHNKPENITGVGFKQVTNSDFQTYTQISEFASVTYNQEPRIRPKTQRRQPNPEVALKVRSILNRSLSNNESDETIHNNLVTYKSLEKVNHENQNKNTPQQTPVQINEQTNERSEEISPTVPQRQVEQKTPSENITINQHKKEITPENSPPSVTPAPRSILKKPSIQNIIQKTEELEIQPQNENSLKQSISLEETNSNNENKPPAINYSTLPKNKTPSRNRLDDDLMSFSNDEDSGSEFGTDYAKINLNSNENEDLYAEISSKHKNSESEYEDQPNEDAPYVISIEEGKGIEVEYAVVQKDRPKKKSITFEDNVSIISDDNLYTEVMNTLEDREKQRLSESSTSSKNSEDDNKDAYGNDYTNTKRTSYFQAGNSTYSTQAASIFFGGKKPEQPQKVTERRPTKMFDPEMMRRVSLESDTSA